MPVGYYIYRAMSSSHNAIYQFIGSTTSLQFDDTNIVKDTTYYYKVKSYNYSSSYNDSIFSDIDEGSY